jgi:excinuclease ABC subunit C
MPNTSSSDTPETVGVAQPAAATARPAGPDVIAAYLKTLPGSPGVYRMLDGAGNVLYVGKARSLKARVSSYARGQGHSNRIARMISATASMEFVLTKTESEALLLEANLIKRFRPRFNVLLRDDKSFPYILISREHAAPQILKHRGARNRKGEYFGPFASAGAVNNTINTLQRAFLLRSCSDSVYESRTRPCLLHQIKRCSAPCTGEIQPPAYGELVQEAVRFLKGESQYLRRHLQDLMQEASDKLEFERAAEFRNRLRAISHVTSDQNINPEGIEEADVFAAHQDGGMTCVQVFFFRTGQNWGNRAYFPRADRGLSPEEVLDSFVAQFYDDKPVPRLVLLSHVIPSHALMAEALSIKAERKVEIWTPQRGEKRAIVMHAVNNAREAHGRRLAESASQRRLLDGMVQAFGLPGPPRRIEVYDNSHIQGAHAVGAMIVAGAEGLVKNQYRKFNIKTAAGAAGDDFGMMREVLTRRFKRLADAVSDPPGLTPLTNEPFPVSDPPGLTPSTNATASVSDPPGLTPEMDDEVTDPEAFPNRPDLVLIDGGPGQLAVAHEVLEALGVSGIALIGVAKGPDRDAGREHFHKRGGQPFMLETRDPVLYFVQRLRDEAHRFAIGTHRAKRSKAIGANPLDEIAGIGPTRRRALLKHFGSAKGVSRAAVPDLLQVDGISQQMAQAIYDFFHDGGES